MDGKIVVRCRTKEQFLHFNLGDKGWNTHREDVCVYKETSISMPLWNSFANFSERGLTIISFEEYIKQVKSESEENPMNDRDFLIWLHERIENVFGVNPNTDYMTKLMCIAESITSGCCTPNVSKPCTPDVVEAKPKFQEIEPDFTGCHPDIAEILGRGKYVECMCSRPGVKAEKKRVRSYNPGSCYKYTVEGGAAYSSAEPLPAKQTYVLGLKDLLQAMLDRDILPLIGFVWVNGDDSYKEVFEYCGKLHKPEDGYSFEPWMLEEK